MRSFKNNFRMEKSTHTLSRLKLGEGVRAEVRSGADGRAPPSFIDDAFVWVCAPSRPVHAAIPRGHPSPPRVPALIP
jgi:hypothetical protein